MIIDTHRNLDNMIKYAKECNDEKKRDEFLNVSKSKNGEIKVILSGIILFLLLWWYYESNSTKMMMEIIIPFFVFIFGSLAIYVRCLRNKKMDLINKNSPLLCYESEIVEIKKHRSTKMSRPRIRTTRYWVELQHNVRISILADEYFKLLEFGIKKVKVYFIEELLDNYQIFKMEPVFETIIQEPKSIEYSGSEVSGKIENEEKCDGNKNLDRLISKATIVRNRKAKERNVVYHSGVAIYMLFLGFVGMTFLLGYYAVIYSQPLLWILVVLFLLPVYVFALFAIATYKMNRIISKIMNNNLPLLVAECNVVDIRTQKRFSYNGWKMEYFIILDDNVQIEIKSKQYEEITENHIKKINIYFYEDLLINNEQFNIEYR